MTYGYSSRGDGSYRIRDEGVALDVGAGLVRLTATHDHYGRDPMRAEFPLVLARVCRTCGEPVTVYARGSISSFLKQIGPGAFDAPWDKGQGWKLVDAPGGFALVANQGHKFDWIRSALSPTCREHSLRLVLGPSQPETTRPRPTAPVKRPPRPKTPKAAAIATTPTECSQAPELPGAPPPGFVEAAAPPESPDVRVSPNRPRVQLTFSW